MDKLHGDRAFANTRRYPLDRPEPDVAHHENSRYIGLQQAWLAIEGPAFRPPSVPHQFRTGQDEPSLITLNDAVEPTGPGYSTDKNKQGAGGNPLDLPAIAAHDGNRLQPI